MKPLCILAAIGITTLAMAGDTSGYRLMRASRVQEKDEPIILKMKDPTPPGPAPAPDPLPELDLPATISGDVGAFIKVQASTNGEHVRWVALDKGLAVFPGEMLKDSTQTVVMSATPGQYRLLAYTAVGGVPSDPVTVMIVVNGAQPPPAPTPAPTPFPIPPAPFPVPPAPVPVSPVTAPANLWVVMVDDVTQRTPAVAKILTDVQFFNSLRSYGIQVQILNKTDPAAAQFQQMVSSNGGLPIVVLIDSNLAKTTGHGWINKGAGELALPSSTEGIKTLIGKYTGGAVR